MCGIFGVFTDISNGFTNKQLDILGQNIIINQFRGTDSTGLFQVDKKGNSDILKVVGGAGSLFAHTDWEAFQNKIGRSANIVVGHGRAATRGTVKLENAHPFVKEFPSGEILKLVHNGTLEYEQDLPDFNKFDVDSEWIAEMIVRYGPLEALTKIRGAMALVWWNEKEKTINFFRNADRPLHFGRFQTNYDKTFILNSEAAAVRYLSERNGLTSMKKDTPVFYFAPRTHYALKLEDLFGDWETCEEFAAPKPKPTRTYTFANQRWNGYGLHQDEDDDDAKTRLWARERNYQMDLEALKKGWFKFVEFEKTGTEWKRRTQYDNYSILYEPVENGPYLPGLRKMERVWVEMGGNPPQFWVRIVHWDESKQAEYATHVGAEPIQPVPPKQGSVIPFKGAASTWDDADFFKGYADVGCQKFSPGRKFRWTTRDGSRTIRHVAQIANEGGPELKSYKNDADGSFGLGDQIMIEVTTMNLIRRGTKDVMQVEGTRVEEKVDRCVDVLCYYDSDSEEAKLLIENIGDVNKIPFISGVIGRMELATKDRNLDTNACVVLILQDMEFADEEDVDAKMETANEKSC
jgi:hypothetical protein